jgi:acetoacetyl-CoA synthetase
MHLASISGGTDIASCFVLGVPLKPVWIGEIQGPGLGMAVDVWDDDGKHIAAKKGELVCTRAFPVHAGGFWNDADGAKYHAAYFERFDNVWCHGDFAEWTAHGGMVIHGRSDATLNPGGVRIGTAEIYNQVEQMPEILEALASARNGTMTCASCCLSGSRPALRWTLIWRSRSRRRSAPAPRPRHVPPEGRRRADIPRTKSGKITELAVRDVVHGRRSRTRRRWPILKRWICYRDIPALQT